MDPDTPKKGCCNSDSDSGGGCSKNVKKTTEEECSSKEIGDSCGHSHEHSHSHGHSHGHGHDDDASNGHEKSDTIEPKKGCCSGSGDDDSGGSCNKTTDNQTSPGDNLKNDSSQGCGHEHGNEDAHSHDHDHAHSHEHGDSCNTCGPKLTSASDVEDVDVPEWKKKALANAANSGLELDADYNPFDMKNWNTGASMSITANSSSMCKSNDISNKQDSCCSSKTVTAVSEKPKDNCCPSESVTKTIVKTPDDSCCSSKTGSTISEKPNDSCCSSESVTKTIIEKPSVNCCSGESVAESVVKTPDDSCCSSKSTTNEKPKSGGCSSKTSSSSHGHSHDHSHGHSHNHGDSCSSKSKTEVNKGGCCSNKQSHDHSHDHGHGQSKNQTETQTIHPKPAYVAIIREHSVDIFDINGQMKSFKYIDQKASQDIKQLCFSSHGNDVDLLLTPCFDENGCHGEPKEECFCGVDVPHLHAHYHNDESCALSDKKKDINDMMKLATLTLYPNDENSEGPLPSSSRPQNEQDKMNDERTPFLKKSKSIPISKGLPSDCNSREYKKFLTERGIDDSTKSKLHKIMHHDHYDVLVHNEATGNVHLEHDCNDCGDTDIHGKLDLVYQRKWSGNRGANPKLPVAKGNKKNKRSIRLNFYAIPKKTYGLFESLFTTDTSDRVNIIRCGCGSPRKSQSVSKSHSHASCCPVVECSSLKVGVLSSNKGLNDRPNSVKSKIFVKQICCASEIPMINDVVKPLVGVSDVKVNTTTKIVYVTHNPDVVTAEEITSALNDEKFGATLKLDGSISLRKSQSVYSDNVKSKIHVEEICCASEIPMINDVVKPIDGVTDVLVNTITKIVYVTHNTSTVSAGEIVSALNKEKFGATLKLDGSTALQKSQQTTGYGGVDQNTTNLKFVESTFIVSSIFDEDVVSNVKQVLSHQYKSNIVSNVETHILSQTIKVDHNPQLVKADDILKLLLGQGLDLTIYADGFKEGIWTIQVDDEPEEHKPTLQWHIALSGVFWLVSMLHYIGGNWKYLQYFGLPSVALGAPKIAIKAFAVFKRLQFDTNCMMLFATVGAIALQDYSEAAAVAFLFSLSEWLESMSSSRARNALSSIAKLRPERARVKDNATNKFVIVPVASVPVGSIVSVPTGDKVPCDGIVVGGTSTLDESAMTGESRPIRKSAGDTVSGGTINSGRAQLLVKTTALADDSAVARLIQLVEEAQINRSPTEELIDEFAKMYTPVVVLAALCMCTFPWIAGSEIGHEWTKIGLVTIVIACPCALIISTPVTYVAGIAAAAQRGIVIKGGVHLEAIARVNRIAFDKTGTLTKGNFKLLHLRGWNPSFSRKEVFQYLHAMEANASHPLAVALVAAAKSEEAHIPDQWTIEDHENLDGEGVTAQINGKEVYVGNMRLFDRLGLLSLVPKEEVNMAKEWMQNGCTVGFLSVEGVGIVGSYCVADAVRPEARDVISSLHKLNIEPVMLTGDNAKAALHIGNSVGFHMDNIKSQLLPHEKLDYIKEVVAESENNFPKNKFCSMRRRQDLILMCGDGVNDAPALTMADVGVAMGAGAAIAMESADATLLDSDLRKLLTLIKLSKRVSRTIIENVVFSCLTKAMVMGFTFAGYHSLWAAIAVDVGAMLIVTLNGMKLLPSKKSIRNQTGYDAKRIENNGDLEDQLSIPLI